MFHQLSRIIFILATLSVLPLGCSPSRTRNTPHSKQDDNKEIESWKRFHSLINAERGTEVPGISELKKYLQQFGYFNANHTDTFDEILEDAVRHYQVNHGIKASGMLDLETVSSISTPRCGVADMNSKGVPHATGRFAYFPGQPRWDRSVLTYALIPSYTIDYLDSAEVFDVLRRAFGRWSAVTSMTFVETDDFTTADIKIGFYGGDHGDGEPFDGVLGVLAHSFAPGNGHFHLDVAERWATNLKFDKSKRAVDLESVATHEIGHVLGLAHSTVKEAIMFPSLSPRTRKVDLTVDDVEGVQLLYGPNPGFNVSELTASYPLNLRGVTAKGNLGFPILARFLFAFAVWLMGT